MLSDLHYSDVEGFEEILGVGGIWMNHTYSLIWLR